MDYTYLQQRSIFYFNIRLLNEAEKYTDLAAQHAQDSNDIFVAFHTWQLRSGIKVEVNKLDEAEYSIRKAWEIASQAGNNSTTWKIRCMPSLLRIFEKKEQADSVNWYLQLGDKLLKEIPSSGIAAIGYIQVRASMEDTADVTMIEGGNFGIGFAEDGTRLEAITDPETVFGYDNSLGCAVVYEQGGITEVEAQTQKRCQSGSMLHVCENLRDCIWGKEKYL